MRGKFSKSLRRLAEKLAAGANITEKVSYLENQAARKREYVFDANSQIVIEEHDGKKVAATREISMGTVTVNPKTVRGIYLKLKAAACRVENGSAKAKKLAPNFSV